MQRFTYARTGDALRSKVTMLLVLLSSDLVFWLGLALFLSPPWRWWVLAGGLLLTLGLFWHLSGMLRRSHRLEGEALHLDFFTRQVRIDRADIREVAGFKGALPHDVEQAGLSYRAGEDTLYGLAGRKGLVALTLARPYEVKVPRKGICQFTRLVISLDEPERFFQAFAGAAAGPVTWEPEAAPVGVRHVEALPDGPAAIRLQRLVRRYGSFTAVNGIDLAVRPGEVLAFLGANGAGKSTTIRMMTGLLRPTSGQVLIDGHDLWAEGGGEARRLVGYVPDLPLLYESLTAREFLWFMAGLYGLDEQQGRRRAEELLAMLKLERFADAQLRSFSLGMKRKMAIAAALIHRPRVLLLDEVTNGLDPRAAREVKDFIAEAARTGAAVFLTTHILGLAEELAHRIAVIHAGEIRALGSLDELRAQAGRPDASLEELFLALTGERSPEEEVPA